MRFVKEEGVIIFDNLLEGDREFGDVAEAVKTMAPAEEAVAQNAVGTFNKRDLETTHANAVKFGEAIRACYTE